MQPGMQISFSTGETKPPLHQLMAQHRTVDSSGQDSAVHLHLQEKKAFLWGKRRDGLIDGQTQWVLGHSYASIKITIFKTLRRLDTTWNFARSITRVSTHEHEHWEHCFCTQSLLKKKGFWTTHVSSSCFAPGRHGSKEVSISECNVTLRES